ncbi:MAG: hypothetical protein COZ08_04690 [Bacteroidetes bacterium CG_4_10_14_3_um_filter_42_6]|nr:MAG: hypothetical protein COZ08_04690 [Bacteroidetes bacterium CG_4_10_14_3_um_filter_42_6]
MAVVLFFNVIQIVVLYQELVRKTVKLPTIRLLSTSIRIIVENEFTLINLMRKAGTNITTSNNQFTVCYDDQETDRLR